MKLFNRVASFFKTKTEIISSMSSTRGWFSLIGESSGGFWQRFINIDAPKEIVAFSGVYACVTIIATDIAKLGFKLFEEDFSQGISVKVKRNSPYLSVINKPNKYQTWYKFAEQWTISKLLYGNTYVLKDRDARGIVTAMYILDASRVTPLVTDNGDVYYRLSRDNLSGLKDGITVPSSEIIHDMMVSLWHPLAGVSPIYACGLSATMGNRIQSNSTHFFQNMSRPSGTLTTTGHIDDETAARLKTEFEKNFAHGSLGRLLVAGDGLDYKPMTIPASDAQLIEQLKWTVEDVARCFHVPMFKLGGPEPPRTSVESLNQTYYSDCLQGPIESMEACLNDGLGLTTAGYEVRANLNNLLRMDTGARYTAKNEAVKGGWLKVNEARQSEDLPPTDGGDTCYMQEQNYSLAALAKRDALDNPFGAKSSTPTVSSSPTSQAEIDANAADAASSQGAAALLDYISRELAYAA